MRALSLGRQLLRVRAEGCACSSCTKFLRAWDVLQIASGDAGASWEVLMGVGTGKSAVAVDWIW